MSRTKKIFIAVTAIVAVFAIIQVINAAKYKMIVNVVDGQNVMGVNPLGDNLDFGDLSRNNGMIRYITLKSGGSVPVYVIVWKSGEISDLVKLDRNFFTLDPSSEAKLAFELQVPPSANTRKYSGDVWIFRLPKLL